MAVLHVPARSTATSRALAAEAVRRGLDVVPVRGPADVGGEPAHLFGGPDLARRVAALTPLALLEPHDDWLVTLPHDFRRRDVRLLMTAEVRALPGRWFVKLPREKSLEPGVYTGDALSDLDDRTPLLVSDVVAMTAEWRFWVLDGDVRTGSSYRRDGAPDARPLGDDEEGRSALAFVRDVLEDQVAELPSAVVVDVGWVSGPAGGWAVVEANMAWFSSLYAADPARALDVVLRAAGPPVAVAPRDRPFVRV